MQTPKIIDQPTFTRLLDSVGGDVDFLSELVDAYFMSSQELFAAIQQAIANGDALALQRAAHSLKTGSASFGALAFAAQCKELEDMGRMDELTNAEEKTRSLAAAYAEVTVALQSQLHSAYSSSA